MTLAELGSSTGGIWTRRQALAVLTPGRVDGLVRRGQWQVLWPGTYADAGIALGVEQRGHAAVLASHDGAVACGRLAARLHGLPLIDDDDPATGRCEHLVDDVAVAQDAVALAGQDPEGRVRRLQRHEKRYDAAAVTTVSGVRATTLLQTVADCARLLRQDALVCLLDAALHRKQLTTGDVAQLIAERRWQPGVTALRAAADLADGRAETPLETLGRLVLLPFLPGLEPQHRLRDAGGFVLARFDLAHVLLRLAVEGDGKAAHEGARSAARDHRRDRVSNGYGWRTERYTWFEVRCRQDDLVRRILAAGRDQARRHRLRIL